MDRDNLRARLEDIYRLSIEEKITAYEELFENVDVQKAEEFMKKDGSGVVVLEIQRRVRFLYLLAKNLEMKGIANRAKSLLNKFQ